MIDDRYFFAEAAKLSDTLDSTQALANVLRTHSHQNMCNVNLSRSNANAFGLNNQVSLFFKSNLELPTYR